MNTPSRSNPGKARRRVLAALGGLLKDIGRRAYSLLLILVILWLSWRAILYLVAALILPARPPAQIVDIPTRLTESVLMRRPAAHGLAAPVKTRSPLAHYHRLDQGFQADSLNGCTASQCHSPLPHGQNKADRAFLNMHATSIHCAVCHVEQKEGPLPLAWYDLKTGNKRAQPPALLQAYAWLTSPSIRHTNTFSLQDQAEIVRLLRQAATEAGGEASLASLAEHLAAVRAASDEFGRLVKVTRQALPGHFRGEYGAKLALLDPRTRQPLLQPDNPKAARQYLARRHSLTGEEKEQLLRKIHPPRRTPTLHCRQCHQPEGSLVDFLSLGYPPARLEAISSPLVTSAIDHIVEGKPFHLPAFLGREP